MPHRRLAATLASALAVAASTTGIALAADTAPGAETQVPTAVTSTTAVLHGLVTPDGEQARYWFEVGTTTAYGISTNPATAGSGKTAVIVNHGIEGLQPQTTYHVRVVAADDKDTTVGGDVTFTTPAADTATEPGGSTLGPSAPAPLPGTELGPAPKAPPAVGRSVQVLPASGAVLVRVPGAVHAAVLAEGASVPFGSVLDTRDGTVTLRTALPGGATQAGTFHGGVFEVRQPVGGRGMVELVLRGPLATCAKSTARAAATTRRNPPRSLWGHDRHGRFRTRASNSVVTVRGTTWYVADRCDGTYTHVKTGSVSVRDLRTGRTVVVRAGHSHLAKSRR
jgi:hypothetical protein